MVLEATMIVLDNSEFTRNGDYPTTRFDAQLDSIDIIFNVKLQSNPENTIGLLSMADNNPQVLTTFTNDLGKVKHGVRQTKINGKSHFLTGIQIAALALKHRQNKIQHQRIILFIASPIQESEKDLEKLAKKLKKNNIAIDIINFGEITTNTNKLEKFISLVDNHENSHLLTVPPSDSNNNNILSNIILSSAILSGDSGNGAGVGSSGGFDNFGDGFDFDANGDEDLALALRLSLEEEKARVEREQKEKEKTKEEKLENVKEEDKDGDTKMN